MERRFAQQLLFEDNLSPTERREKIRFLMREIACHQAGHAVMQYFTGFPLGKMPAPSILLEEISSELLYSDNIAWESWLKSAPPPLKRVSTLMVLLYLLAGCGAQNVADKVRKAKRRPILDQDIPLEYRSADVRRATRVAESMATPELQASRLLAQAEKWTLKLFRRRDVQRAARNVAELLLKHGALTDRQLKRACREIHWLATRLPEWNRLFCLNQKEGQMLCDVCHADDGTLSCRE